MRKLLAVMPRSGAYLPSYTVTVAKSFEQAKSLILQAEEAGMPFDDLDLPVYDEALFREFLDWMDRRGRKYPFSIFGEKSTEHFGALCEECRARGFHFNT